MSAPVGHRSEKRPAAGHGGRRVAVPWVRRWLIDSGFATVERDGSLQPTPLGAEIGRAVAAATDEARRPL
jgi:hypothetical protein